MLCRHPLPIHMPAARKPAEKPVEAITPAPTHSVLLSNGPFPNYADFPDLSEVAEEKDFKTRVIGHEKYPNGSINYDKPVTAKYLNHATVSRLLKLHAPGWEFELKHYVDPNGTESLVWPAPNGTGLLYGFFRAPVGSGFKNTTCYPYAITNHKNQPLAANLLSCTDICNSERRALAACAGRFFSLGWHEWATDHTQDEHAAPDNFVQQVDVQDVTPGPAKQIAQMQVAPLPPAAPVTAPEPVAVAAPVPATQPESVPTPADVRSIEEQIKKDLHPLMEQAMAFDQGIVPRYFADFKEAFSLTEDQPLPQTQEQVTWCKQWLQMAIEGKGSI